MYFSTRSRSKAPSGGTGSARPSPRGADGLRGQLGQVLLLLVLGQRDAPLPGRLEQDHLVGEPVEEPAQGFGRQALGVGARRLEVGPEVGVVELARLDAQDRPAAELALDEAGDPRDRALAVVALAGGGEKHQAGQDGRAERRPRRGLSVIRMRASIFFSINSL